MELPVIKTLSTGELTLELLNTMCPTKAQGYAERSSAWINDPAINQYLGTQETTIEKSTDWYRNMPSKITTDRTFAVWLNEQHIGNCGIHDIDLHSGYGELGIVIGDSKNHSQGIGTTVIRRVSRHAFEDLGLRKLILHVLGNNHRGIRCYKKCDFVEVGRMKSHIQRNGEYHDYVTMELFAT